MKITAIIMIVNVVVWIGDNAPIREGPEGDKGSVNSPSQEGAQRRQLRSDQTLGRIGCSETFTRNGEFRKLIFRERQQAPRPSSGLERLRGPTKLSARLDWRK